MTRVPVIPYFVVTCDKSRIKPNVNYPISVVPEKLSFVVCGGTQEWSVLPELIFVGLIECLPFFLPLGPEPFWSLVVLSFNASSLIILYLIYMLPGTPRHPLVKTFPLTLIVIVFSIPYNLSVLSCKHVFFRKRNLLKTPQKTNIFKTFNRFLVPNHKG